MNNENKIYTATDFAKYHAGTMPAKEMHALEKACLEDDFLADALEGYAFTQTEDKDLAEIKSTLARQNDSAKVIPITPKNNWRRYAAAAAIVLGMVTVFYNVNKSNSPENNLAKNEIVKNTPVDSFSNIQAESSVAKSDTVKITGNNEPEIGTVQLNDVTINDVVNTPPSGYTANEPTATLAPNAPNKNFDLSNTRDNSIFQNNVENKKGGPKQFYNYRNNTARNNVDVQNNGTNTILNYPTAKPTSDDFAKFKVNADSIGYNDLAKKDNRSKDKEQLNLVEKRKAEEKSQMEEVVVTGYGTKKAKQITSAATSTNADALTGKVSAVQVNTNSTPLLKGRADENKSLAKTLLINDFNNYVQKNIKPLFDDKGNEIKGKVILSFKTNKKGQPIKIKVVQTVSKKADEQAIELLKNANSWKANIKDRISVEIKF